jgi:hypothetical protein
MRELAKAGVLVGFCGGSGTPLFAATEVEVDVASALFVALGREVSLIDIPHESFMDALKQEGLPEDLAWLMNYLFETVLDGRNAFLSDGVQRALGREPKDFSDYAKSVAEGDLWRVPA